MTGRARRFGQGRAWRDALWGGLAAGTLATVAQLAWWWLAGTPVLATLLRDTRLTAAIVLGRDTLAERPGWPWALLTLATLLHFALSVGYAAVAQRLVRSLPKRAAWPAGALFGLALYLINLYGFTAWFPWFAVSRGGATLFAHLVFGLTVVGVMRR